MKKQTRKFLSLILALSMVLTIIPAFSVKAYAYDGAIDLSNPTGDMSGDGWSWNNNGRVLTLSDAAIDVQGSDAYRAITLPAGSKLVLNGTNTLKLKNTATSATENAVALKCAGSLEIGGTGTLNITSDSDNGKAWGIEVCTSLTYSSAAVNVVSKNDAINVLPAESEECTMTVNSGKITTTVTETADSGNNGITVQKGNFILKGGEIHTLGGCHGIVAGDNSASYTGKITIEGGTVTASAANCGLWAYGDVEISGGTVTATATGTESNDYGINSQSGKVCVSGGTVIANGEDYGIRSKVGNIEISGTDTIVKATGTSVAAIYLSGSAVLSSYKFTITANTDASGAGESFIIRKNAESKVTMGALASAKYVEISPNTLPTWINVGSAEIRVGSDNADDYWTNADATSESAVHNGSSEAGGAWNFHYDESSNILYLSGAIMNTSCGGYQSIIKANGDVNIVLKSGTENVLISTKGQGVISLDEYNTQYDLTIRSEDGGTNSNTKLSIISSDNSRAIVAGKVRLDHVNMTSLTSGNGIMCNGLTIVGGTLDFESTSTRYGTLYSKSGDVVVRDKCNLNIHSKAASSTAIYVVDGSFVCSGQSEVTIDEFYGINTYGLDADADITIEDSTVNVSNSKYAIYAETINSDYTSNININGDVNITDCRNAIYTWGGRGQADINFNGGNINITECYCGIVSYAREGEAEINISAGKINITNTEWAIYSQSNGAPADTNINGGNIVITNCNNGIYTYGKNGPADLNISGGNINATASDGGISCYFSTTPEAISYINISGGEIVVSKVATASEASFWAIGAEAEPRLTNNMVVKSGGKIVTCLYEDEETSPQAFYTVGPEINQRSADVTIGKQQIVYESYEKPSVSVAVSGDKDSIKVQATVNGTTATVNNVTTDELTKVGTGENVVIDLTTVSTNVTGVTIPKSTFENIAESEAEGLEVKFPNGTTATFDNETLKAISEQAAGSNIQLVVAKDSKAESSMNVAQKEAIKDMGDTVVLDAYFVSGGNRISDFKGGEAELTAEYKTANPVRVWYVATTGEKTYVPSTYDGNVAKFKVDHFSHYVIEELNGTSYQNCAKDESCVAAQYADLDLTSWYHDGIHYCIEKGILYGTSDTTMNPSMALSRATVITMLWRIAGEPVVNYSMTFTDVPEDTWYTEAVRWAASLGIVSGYSDITFAPADAVKRQDLSCMIYNYEKTINKGGFTGTWMFNLEYPDASDIAGYAGEAMRWVVMKGIVTGSIEGDKTYLLPNGTATRAEAAAMIQRFCETFEK